MKSKRDAIKVLHDSGMRIAKISRRLNGPDSTVRVAIKRYKELGTTSDRPRSGCPTTATDADHRRKVRQRFERNPRRSLRKVGRDVGISHESVRKTVKNVLGLKPYKQQEAHLLTETTKTTRLERCKRLKRRFGAGQHRRIVFSDEKLFTIKIVGRSQKPKSVMVWGGVTHSGKTPLVFIDEGVKVNQDVYRQQILEQALLPWAQQHFCDEDWTFQQDSAPSHKARTVQE
uniref:Transposase n=1 Tax=Plectus sambesii TaxID=2011161 RepID=A0A914VSL0_9BILA